MISMKSSFFALISLLFIKGDVFASESPNLLSLLDEMQINILVQAPKEAMCFNICKKWKELTDNPEVRFRVFNLHYGPDFPMSSKEILQSFSDEPQAYVSLKFSFTPSSWDCLRNFSNLKKLSIYSKIRIPLSSLSHLSKLEKLDFLSENIQHPSGKETLEDYCQLPMLKSLYIKDDDLSSNAAHSWIASLTTLESLYIISSGLGSNGGKAALAPLTNLTKLHADWNELGEGVSHLSILTNLTELNLPYNNCTNASLGALTTLQNLKFLSISELGRDEDIENIAETLKAKIPGLRVST